MLHTWQNCNMNPVFQNRSFRKCWKNWVFFWCQHHFHKLDRKKLLFPDITWCMTDCKDIRTHNLLVHKQTLNDLAKLAKWLSIHFGCGFEFQFRLQITSGNAPVLSKEFYSIQAATECRFTLKHVFNMLWTYSHNLMHVFMALPLLRMILSFNP